MDEAAIVSLSSRHYEIIVAISVIKSSIFNSFFTYDGRFGDDMHRLKDLPDAQWIYIFNLHVMSALKGSQSSLFDSQPHQIEMKRKNSMPVSSFCMDQQPQMSVDLCNSVFQLYIGSDTITYDL
jgi:hypothetical protein